MGRLLIIPLALIAMLAAAVAWSGSGNHPRADFVFINRGDIYTLDLNQMSYMQDFRLTYALREGLYSPENSTLHPIPAGATGYDLSDDQRVWTFHLRHKCVWSNGDPVTAHDYVFSWRRFLEEPGEYSYLFNYIKNAQAYSDGLQAYYTDATKPRPDFKDVGIEAPDDDTLRVTLINPVPYFLELIAFPPFYPRNEKSMEPFKTILNEATGQYTYRNDYTRPPPSKGEPGVVTNGPFYLDRWDFKQRLVLLKSPTYWDKDHVQLNSIEMQVNDNPLSQFLQYEAGHVDWMADVPTDLAPELMAQGRPDLKNSPAFGTAFLTLMVRPNLPSNILGGGKNPLADVRVRQALAMTIDRHFIIDNITRMGELPARTYLSPDGTLPAFKFFPGAFDTDKSTWSDVQMRALLAKPDGITNPAAPGLPFDITHARQLLAEAGYPNGKDFPRLPIMFNTQSTMYPKEVQALKNQWKQALNINMDIMGLEGKVFKERVNKKEYAIAPASWYGDYPDVSTFTDKYRSDSLNNDSDWQVKQFDALCDQAAQEADPKKRMDELGTAEAMIDSQVPIIPLYHYVNTSLEHPNIHGVDPNPRGVTIFKGVWVDKQ